MSANVWLLYLVTVFFMSATPGPNMLLAMTHGMRYGRRRTMVTCAGLMTGIMVVMLASMLGLGALLAASEALFSAVKYAGAAYLVYLGLKLWRARSDSAATGDETVPALVTDQSPFRLFRTGFLVSLSNPKAFLFFTALFPQFFDKQAAEGPQLAILIATFMVIECMWQMIYVTGGQGAARYLGTPSRTRMVNRVSGSIFIGLALWLTTAQRA
ncbi:LysE family translocator [Govanella unica]|uniref:LysE family translocator n=1 Tax=Govanella unica TaxID=2975056 RepID=A0A9X3TZU7_9PROT|nr:LysE family translocator [Govania unica]MDA5194848.1 LysE family translocator [Govania unica]